MNKTNRSEIELLEIRINDAADGLLNQQEIADLENDLLAHPNLLLDYQQIMNLPDFSKAYGGIEKHQHPERISSILEKIEQIEHHKPPMNFEHITIHLFKKYAIAASFAILAVTSFFNLSQLQSSGAEMAMDELFYPESDLGSDEYVTYLHEWIEQ